MEIVLVSAVFNCQSALARVVARCQNVQEWVKDRTAGTVPDTFNESSQTFWRLLVTPSLVTFSCFRLKRPALLTSSFNFSNARYFAVVWLQCANDAAAVASVTTMYFYCNIKTCIVNLFAVFRTTRKSDRITIILYLFSLNISHIPRLRLE